MEWRDPADAGMPPQDLEILGLVVDDYFGLWEVLWRVDTVFGDSLGPAVDATRSAVERLHASGLVSLWVREGVDDEPVPLDRFDRQIDLSAATTWTEPRPGEPQMLMLATARGEAELLSGGHETAT